MLIFDRRRIRHLRARAGVTLPGHDFLIDFCAENLFDRLHDIRRAFASALVMDARIAPQKLKNLIANSTIKNATLMDSATALLPRHTGPAIAAYEDALPFANGAFDLVMAIMNLHNVSDLPGALLQIRRILKSDGLFLAAFPGGETLFDLRNAFTATEIALHGGAGPRLHPVIDKQQAGALLQRAGFALPVVDSDTLRVSYTGLIPLLHDLKRMGEGIALTARNTRYPGRNFFRAAEQGLRAQSATPDGRLEAVFEVITMTGWAPHGSQQKPLARGSGKTSMADVL